MILIDLSALRKRIGEFTWKMAIAVVAGLVVIIVAGIFGLQAATDGGSPTDTNPNPSTGPATSTGDRSMVEYTVEDDVKEGVWALQSPVMERFLEHSERPLNARRWIPNGKKVIVACAREGTPYEVEVNGRTMRWKWFARLADGSWFPLAGFSETTEDGSQGLVSC
jgi:hypothetical protein